MPIPRQEDTSDAAEWLRRGQACETVGTPESLAGALDCYQRAIALFALRTDAADATGIAWMNRGNALQKIGTPEALAASTESYDRAIALLGRQPGALSSERCNSLGAAWMNRGLALHRQGTRPAVSAALASLREAVNILRLLPAGESRWYRRNLAAANLNLANVLLDSAEPDRLRLARETAREAIVLVGARESDDPVAAELGLKARRVLCDAIGQLLVGPSPAATTAGVLAAEASDLVDDALALLREWENSGHPEFGELAVRFLRFGARLYAQYQPQFLAEFLLENEPAVLPSVFRDIALESIDTALNRPQLHPAPAVDIERPLRTARELQALRVRLRAGHP